MAKRKNKEFVVDIFIPFDKPPTKQRGRAAPVFAKGRFIKVQVWTPAETKKNMKKIASYVSKQVTDYDGKHVFKLKVTALFKRPAALMKKMTEDIIIIGKGGSYPDWDNIGKIVSDGLNKYVWNDDAQVGDGRAIRRYIRKVDGVWEEPGLKIKISVIGEII